MLRRALVLLPLVLSACPDTQPGNDAGVPFTFTVDPALVPQAETISAGDTGESVVGVLADSEGVVTEMVVDEVVIRPTDPAQLEAFLTRVGGTVLWNNEIPMPPEGVQLRVPVSELAATTYTVRVDASAQSLSGIDAAASAYGLHGAYRFSSDAAAKLLALVVTASADGFKVAPNFVSHPDDVVFATQENGLPDGGFNDALVQPYVTRTTGARTGVGGAWQYLEHHGVVRRTKVAIFDSGFNLDGAGVPNNDLPDGTDFVGRPLQYDFLGRDYNAGGAGVGKCGGVPCPWHGQGAAGAATGVVDNRRGAVGSGGTVADPILFKMRTASDYVDWAMRTAIAWGADVVSMSFGGACNEACREGKADVGFYESFDDAVASGIVLVASAGNGGGLLDGTHKEPCSVSGVICVGALETGTFDKPVDYSDFGVDVDLFGPTDIWSHADPTTSGMNFVYNGTSAAAPWVAGVTAMMKALDPSLTTLQVAAILQRTAHLAPPPVNRSLDALAAVIDVGGPLATDGDEGNDTAAAAKELVSTSVLAPDSSVVLTGRTLHSKTDQDHYRLVIHDHSSITASLVYGRELSNVYFQLIPEGETQPPVSPVRAPNSRGFGYGSPMLAPGSYRVLLNGENPQKYELSLATITQPLDADVFELNESAGEGATPPNGDHTATLHGEIDVDWYRIVSTTADPKQHQVFFLEWSDLPVNVEVFDSAGGTLLASHMGVRTTPAIDVPDERRIRVTRTSGRSRYGFTSDKMISAAELGRLSTLTTDFWWLDLANLKPGFVSDDDEWFVFVHSNNLSQPSVILEGGGLELELFDSEAQRLATGVPGVTRNGTVTRLIDLAALNLTSGQTYALKVARGPELDAPPQPESAPRSPLGFTLWVGD